MGTGCTSPIVPEYLQYLSPGQMRNVIIVFRSTFCEAIELNKSLLCSTSVSTFSTQNRVGYWIRTGIHVLVYTVTFTLALRSTKKVTHTQTAVKEKPVYSDIYTPAECSQYIERQKVRIQFN